MNPRRKNSDEDEHSRNRRTHNRNDDNYSSRSGGLYGRSDDGYSSRGSSRNWNEDEGYGARSSGRSTREDSEGFGGSGRRFGQAYGMEFYEEVVRLGGEATRESHNGHSQDIGRREGDERRKESGREGYSEFGRESRQPLERARYDNDEKYNDKLGRRDR